MLEGEEARASFLDFLVPEGFGLGGGERYGVVDSVCEGPAAEEVLAWFGAFVDDVVETVDA